MPVNLTSVQAKNEKLENPSDYSTEIMLTIPAVPHLSPTSIIGLGMPEQNVVSKDFMQEEANTEQLVEKQEESNVIVEELEKEESLESSSEEDSKQSSDVFEPAVEETKKFYRENIPLDEDLQDYTYQLCQEYNVDYSIIFAVMHTESRFDPKAHNKGSD